MNAISNLLGHILRIIFEFVNNYGLSIVVFTLFVRLLLVPLMIKQIKSQKAMQDIQPKIKEIQEKYKNKPEKQQEELMKIKINPLAGCLPLLIQMPILIGLFRVLQDPVAHGVFTSAAEFAKADTGFLWIQSVSSTKHISLALLSGISAYFMQKMMTTGDEQTENMMKSMTYVMAIMSLFWGYTFQAGLAIYWITSNLFSIAQYQLITSPLKAKLADSKEALVKDEKSGKSNINAASEKNNRNKK